MASSPPASSTKRMMLLWDTLFSLFLLAFGRLMPRLNPTPKRIDLSGKTAIVTGGNSGIGLQIAINLARLGCTVYIACRNEDKAKSAINDIITKQAPSSIGRVKALKLDTSSSESVQAFAETWSNLTMEEKQIDILVHNAGIAAPAPSAPDLTDDGIDVVYATNLLGSFTLTHLLESHLSPTARVIFTTSSGQYGAAFTADFSLGPVCGVIEPGFHCPLMKIPWLLGAEFPSSGVTGRYSNTKGMQCVLARLLQKRFDRQELLSTGEKSNSNAKISRAGRTAHSFTPGFTKTPIFGKFESKGIVQDWLFVMLKAATAIAIDVDQGAATGTWLASTNDPEVVGWGKGGGYWDRMTRRVSGADVMNDQLMDRLWLRWERDSAIEWR